MFRALILITLLLRSLSRAAVLVDFQVAQPPPLPQNAKQCTVKILQHTFGFSFGSPEIVQFTPPTDCGLPGSWAGISLNFTGTSNGTQFDRLSILTFQHVEIWRTSTPEPTRGDGIIWTYLKDVTRYIPLFAKPGTFILQLDNLLKAGLDGQYTIILSATFFASSKNHPPAKQAHTIIPISTLSTTTGNVASVPPGFSLNITVPQNTVELYAEIFASGNGGEEFWYLNAANDFVSDLPAGTASSQGPFREVRLQIDGQVAGVAFPYVTIFTGGILPTVWRPITSYGAFDLPTYFLDLTPFVPILTDGKPHNFTLDVASAEANHTITPNWFISGLLQVVVDPSSKPTTGKITSYSAKPFADSTVTGSVGHNGDVNITVKATRQIHVESDIISGSGKSTHVVWSQNLEYSNFQTYTNNALVQTLAQNASGSVLSTHNDVPAVTDLFSFPINIVIAGLVPNFSHFEAAFDHSYDRFLVPSPFICGSTIRERQQAGGFFSVTPKGNTGNGTSNNTFTYVDIAGNTYDREVNAALNNITFDHQGGSLAPSNPFHHSTFPEKEPNFGVGRLLGGRVMGSP